MPSALWVSFAALLAAQVVVRAASTPAPPSAEELPPAPRPAVLRAVALGEAAAAARLGMVYLLAFDQSAANATPYRHLDYSRLTGWLRTIRDLDPRSDAALFAAARVYAENPDGARSRMALAFVHESFLQDPGRRWPWLAHAALLAKHRLRDLPLARRYAADVARLASGADVPDWARQMEIFVLEDMNEFEAARVLLGAMLEAGRIRDPAERRFLEFRLRELDARVDDRDKRQNR